MKKPKQLAEKSKTAVSSKELRSYDEYLKAFLPKPQDAEMFSLEDPVALGTDLARASLRKLERRLAGS